MNTNTQISRVYYLDVLRLVATLAVIMLHVSCIFLRENTIAWYVGTISDSMSRWGVPVFLMISGSLFLQPDKQVSLSQLYRKYILRLFVALVAWILLYALLLDPMRPTVFHFIHHHTIEYQMGQFLPLKYHLWFLPMMIGVYVLMPILKAIAANRQLMQYYLLLWLLYSTYTFTQQVPALQSHWLQCVLNEFQLHVIYGYSGYFLLGYYLSKINIPRPMFITASVLGILMVGLTALGVCMGGSDFMYEDQAPNVILMSISVFVCCKYIFEKKQPLRMMRVIDYTRSDLFGIYLIHPFVLSFYLFPSIFKGPLSIIIIPAFTVVVFVISLYLTKGLRRIPFIKKIC